MTTYLSPIANAQTWKITSSCDCPCSIGQNNWTRDSDSSNTLAIKMRSLKQARREGGVGGKLPRAPRRLGGAPSLRNTKKIHHAPFWKGKFKIVLHRGAPRECFPGPRPLWLSTGLVLKDTRCPLNVGRRSPQNCCRKPKNGAQRWPRASYTYFFNSW